MASQAAARYARVALDIPGADGFDYGFDEALRPMLTPGAWVLVPWGRGRRIGLVAELVDDTPVPADRIRPLIGTVPSAPQLPASWLNLVRFAAGYYHRGFGEVALPAIPKLFRAVPPARARGSEAMTKQMRNADVPPARARGSAFERARQLG
ncbi:MAG TPA: primosomal protein N', partial [Quisquiliibacterium sp.]|nr:primosomal protein N' [Quisquiliibacterium sp.]